MVVEFIFFHIGCFSSIFFGVIVCELTFACISFGSLRRVFFRKKVESLFKDNEI